MSETQTKPNAELATDSDGVRFLECLKRYQQYERDYAVYDNRMMGAEANGAAISANPGLIQMEQARQWDGALPPNYGGGSGQGPQIYMMITPRPSE